MFRSDMSSLSSFQSMHERMFYRRLQSTHDYSGMHLKWGRSVNV